ncbi:hypothetical protein DV20_29695 [Amycolatopsis rifamycinica]|uniref:Uncharacterized protein n=2 Tax=Amycolatopsis rifamycinica TaxID=287986 RepID=A0A066TUD0_9PSEU|nr:hypothetical protein DV20_29695 [Amycolatopsis rifamycinica]
MPLLVARAIETPGLPVAAGPAETTAPPLPVARMADQSTPDPPPSPVVQRDPEPAPAAPPAVVAAPTAVAAVSPPPQPQPETEELVKKLFDPLLRRLKTELRLDRERRGALTDRPH